MISSSATTQDAASQQAGSVTVTMTAAIIPTNGIAVNAIFFIFIVNSLWRFIVVQFRLFSRNLTSIHPHVTITVICRYYCIDSFRVVSKLTAPRIFPAFYPRLNWPTDCFTIFFGFTLLIRVSNTTTYVLSIVFFILHYDLFVTFALFWKLLAS